VETARRTKTRLQALGSPELPASLSARLLELPEREAAADSAAAPGRPARGGSPLRRTARRAAAAPSPYELPRRPGDRRHRRTVRRVSALTGSTLTVSGLALGMAFWLGGPSAGGPAVDPPVDTFFQQHQVSTPGELFDDPAFRAVEASLPARSGPIGPTGSTAPTGTTGPTGTGSGVMRPAGVAPLLSATPAP
jgi:hypothetical protein